MTRMSECKRCRGKGWYSYDSNHGKPCEGCCDHSDGFFLLSEGFAKAGQYACKKGCGKTQEEIAADDLSEMSQSLGLKY